MFNEAKRLVPDIEIAIQLGHQLSAASKSFNQRTKSMNPMETYDLYRNDTEVKEAKGKLVRHLSQFTDEQVAIIRTVMYVGRDEVSLLLIREEPENPELVHDSEYIEMRRRAFEPTEVLFNESFRNLRNDTKDNAIPHMIGKAPFPKYLNDGLRVLKLI